MATKEYSLSSNRIVRDGLNGHFKNLNLNQNNNCLSFDTVCSKSIISNRKKLNYDFTDNNNDTQSRKKLSLWKNGDNKTMASDYLSLRDICDKEKSKEESKHSEVNKSTLSIHIAAYETLIEASNDFSCEEEDVKMKESSLTKKWKNSKQIFIDSLVVQNPFEFPRQQVGRSNRPEVMQFKASKRLKNPNNERVCPGMIYIQEYAPVNEKAKETIKALIESNTIEDQQEIISTYFNWIYNNHYKYVKSSCFSLLQYLNVSVKENQVDKEQSIFLSKVIVEAFEYELNEANQNEKDHILKQQVSSSLWNKIYNFFHYEIYKTNVFVTIIFKTDKPNLMKKYEKMLNSINYNEPRICQIPSSITEASLIHSKSFEGHEELEEKLLNLDCKFVIFLKQEEGASMEVFLSGKWHQVKNPSGNFCTPAYISFKKEKLEIGETALNVYKKNPEFVLFDMLRLLGRSYDQISPQPSWRFSIAENPRNPNSVVYEVETWQGRRAITPEFAFGIFLKALRRLAEKVSKQPQPHVAIFVPAFYEMAHKDSLKVACSLAGLFITDSIQYPQNDVLVFQNKATDFGVLAEQASSK